MNVLKSNLIPILKYPGGKEKELANIIPALPKEIRNYYEPFVGAGAVYFAIDAKKYYINDKSFELIRLYRMVKDFNPIFINKLKAIDHNWNVITSIVTNHSYELIDLYIKYRNNIISDFDLKSYILEFIDKNKIEFNGLLVNDFNVRIDNFVKEISKSFYSKFLRMKMIEGKKGVLDDVDLLKNIEGAFKNAFYMHMRYLYNLENELLSNNEINTEFATAIYLFIRLYCYASMYRYNSSGGFNVPYGGISYNKKRMDKYIIAYTDVDYLNHLSKTTIGNEDFYKFMSMYPPEKDDFIFLDPPYDSEFSTYANNVFDLDDQKRLANYLINECKGNFMVVIKNTPYIKSLYPIGMKTANNNQISISSFSKRYLVSFQDRNDKEAEHLIITNY